MTTQDTSSPVPVDVTDRDIQFDCPHCNNILVVDKDGAGMELGCPHCGHPVTVPDFSGPNHSFPAFSPAETAETQTVFDFSGKSVQELRDLQEQLSHRLKENKSQRTEIQGYINKATIELHRFQIQMGRLNSRNQEMESELDALSNRLSAPGAS
jgi:DNA-directed RNA polymerase subunit M/transcription elongation factor TFIIS